MTSYRVVKNLQDSHFLLPTRYIFELTNNTFVPINDINSYNKENDLFMKRPGFKNYEMIFVVDSADDQTTLLKRHEALKIIVIKRHSFSPHDNKSKKSEKKENINRNRKTSAASAVNVDGHLIELQYYLEATHASSMRKRATALMRAICEPKQIVKLRTNADKNQPGLSIVKSEDYQALIRN